MLNSATHISAKNESIIDVLRVIQMCDSNFPVGSFNHSFGLETYLRNDLINNTNDMRKWLKVFLGNVFIYSDGLAIKMLYEYLDAKDIDKIYELDRLITVQSIGKETRDGSKLIANRMIALFLDLYDDIDFLKEYYKKISKKEAYGHPAIVFGIIMHNLNFNCHEAISFHMYSTVSTLIANAVRAIPLGQKDGQLLLKEMCESFGSLCEKIHKLDFDYFGGCSPGIELSQINHEDMEFRLFMS